MDIDIKIRKCIRDDAMIVAVDSTGLSLYNYSDWHHLKHSQKANKGRTSKWKKLHIAIDVENGNILSGVYSDSKGYDAHYLPPLLDSIDEDIGGVCADMAYDTKDCRKIIQRYKAKQLIPPRRQASLYKRSRYHRNKLDPNIFKERDDAINYIRDKVEEGYDLSEARSLWKREIGYHQRSLVETTMYQLKSHTTDRLTNKTESNRKTQAMLKCKIVNMINAA